MSDAVFRTVGQALHVAYTILSQPPMGRGNTQAVIEQLMRDAGVLREVERDGTVNLRGLSGLEVRGQCAMIRGAVLHHCTGPEIHAIQGWYAHDASKAEGVRFLREWFAEQFTIQMPEAQMLVTWRANVTEDSKAAKFCSVRDIEGQYHIPRSTAQRNVAAISKRCRALRSQGERRLEPMFIAHGLVGDPAYV